MKEHRIVEANQHLIENATRSTLPSGDTLFTDVGSNAVVMAVGRGYIDYLPELMGLIDFKATNTRRLSGRGTKSKTAWVFPTQLQDGTKVAVKVKRDKGWAESAVPMWMGGIDAFSAVRTLEGEGIDSVDILLATENVIITTWSDDPEINLSDPDEAAEWREFEAKLLGLEDALVNAASNHASRDWHFSWRVDTLPENYRKREGKFVAIDPVWLGVV